MPIVSGRLGFAVALAVLCLSGRSAHAQVTPVPYLASGWPSGFNGNFPGVAGSDARGGDMVSRYNFSNGWFVGSERGGLALDMSGFGAFGNTPSFSYEGVQFGYNLKSAPVTIFAGFDTLKYNTAIGPFAPFDSVSSMAPGYSAHAGVEFRPTSNLSLSLGVGFVQQSGGIDGNLLALPGASPSAFGGRR